MNKNQTRALAVGLALLFLGFQFRTVQSFTLTANATRFVEARLAAMGGGAKTNAAGPTNQYPYASYNQPTLSDGYIPGYRRVVTPPNWVSFVFFSLGTVFVAKGLFTKS